MYLIIKSLLLPLFLIFLILISYSINLLTFHFFSEFFAIFVAFSMGLIAYSTFPYTKNSYILFLGLAYIYIGALDLFHTLTFPGMSLFNITGANTSLNIWVWTRLFEALILLSASLFINKKIPIISLNLLFFTLSSFILYISFYFPLQLFVQNEGLQLEKSYFEYFIIVILLFSLYINKLNKSKFRKNIYLSIKYSIYFTIFAELSFTFYIDVTDTMLLIGHIFKFISFWIIFMSIVRTSLISPIRLLEKEQSSYNAIPISTITVANDGIIIQGNYAAAKEINYKLKDLVGKSNHKLFHNTNIKEEDCYVCRAIKNQIPIREYEVYNKTNNTYTNFSLSKVSLNKKSHSMVQVKIDTSQIKNINKKIANFNLELTKKVKERTNDLEKSNKTLQSNIKELNLAQEHLIYSEKMASLGALVAGVAHEINTPVGIGLTGITHFFDITKEISDNYKNEIMTQEDFEEYLKSSQELAKLIHLNLEKTALLVRSFKQISVDQTNEVKRNFNLKNYLEEILISLKNITKRTNIDINIICEKDIIINTYAGCLSQIITNLIINSIKHAFKNKQLGSITIIVNKNDDEIELIYKDDGAGIKKENLDKILSRYKNL